MKALTCVLFILVILGVFSSSCNALAGVWRDDCPDNQCYGGLMFICTVNDNQIYGRYSDIGFLSGVVYDDGRVEGIWFEAGYSQQNHGGFEWRLKDGDGSSFTGSWWFSERKCDRFGWSSLKISETAPDFAECGVPINLQNERAFEGSWVGDVGNNTLYFCADQYDYLHGSGELFNVDINVAGISYVEGQVLTNSFWSDDGVQGIMLATVISPVDMVVSWWNVPVNELALNRFSEDNLHFADIFRRRDFAGDLENACLANSNIGGLDWNGSWTDPRFGSGKFYVCENSNVAQGVFSELGWIEANTDGDLMFGEIYFSGGRTNSDAGIFQVQLTNNGHTFEGVFVLNGGDDEVNWVANRIDATSFYSENCYTTPQSGTVAGQWLYGKHPSDFMAICIENGIVEMSYSYNGGDLGYGVGFTSATGSQMARITWFEEDTSGIAMYRIQDDDSLVEFFWQRVGISFEVEYDICDEDEVNFDYWGRHSVNRLSRLSTEENILVCSRNRDLFNSNAFDYNLSSNANTVSIPFLLIISLYVLSILFF